MPDNLNGAPAAGCGTFVVPTRQRWHRVRPKVNTMKSKIVIGALLGLLGIGAACLAVAVERPPEQRRAAAQKAFNAGNFNDAYKGFASLATGDADEPFNTPRDFDLAVQSLQRLTRLDE